MICKICNLEFTSPNSLLNHVRFEHNIKKSKEYYDTYLKSEGEDICKTPGCNNITRYKTLGFGYQKHCSYRCSTLDPNVINKNLNSVIEKYGSIEKYKQERSRKYSDNWSNKSTDEIEKTTKKREATSLEKYGYKYAMQREDVKNMIKNNKDQILEKRRKTCLKKYGVEHTSILKETQEKVRKTNIKKYGVTSVFKTHKYRTDQSNRMKNGGAAYCNSFISNPSSIQVKVYNIIKEKYNTAIMNYPCLNYSIDVVIPEISIVVEYDGWYWHEDKFEYDRKRINEIITSSEWNKILIYKDNKNTKYIDMTEERILSDLNYLIESEERILIKYI